MVLSGKFCACLCPQQGWCLEFKTSEVTAFLGQEREAKNFLDYFIMKVGLEYGQTLTWQKRERLQSLAAGSYVAEIGRFPL